MCKKNVHLFLLTVSCAISSRLRWIFGVFQRVDTELNLKHRMKLQSLIRTNRSLSIRGGKHCKSIKKLRKLFAQKASDPSTVSKVGGESVDVPVENNVTVTINESLNDAVENDTINKSRHDAVENDVNESVDDAVENNVNESVDDAVENNVNESEDDAVYDDEDDVNEFVNDVVNGFQRTTVDDDVDQDEAVLPEEMDSRKLMQTVTSILMSFGLERYFTITLKGSKKPMNAFRVVSRFALYLVRSYKEKNKISLGANVEEVKAWYIEIMKDQYTTLLEFADYLEKKRLLAPATIRNYVSDIVWCCHWACVYAPADLKQPTHILEGIKQVAKDIRSLQNKKQRHVGSELTMAKLVETRHAPAGGIPELQEAVNSKLSWAESLRKEDIDDITYKKFMQLFYASVLVSSPQGRLSGILDMSIDQAPQLMEEWFATSTMFKTNTKYGYQPVTMGHASHFLLSLYLKHYRPQVCTKRDPPSRSLWLTYEGETDLNLSRHVRAFFKQELGLILGSNVIRSLLETHMHQQQLLGNITAQERNAVMNVNGHGGAVTKDYYIMEDRVNDVIHASRAFEATLGVHSHRIPSNPLEVQGTPVRHMSEGLVDNTTERIAVPNSRSVNPLINIAKRVKTTPSAMQWGANHPSPPSLQRAVWTHAEKEYVGNWCDNFQRQYGGGVKTVVSKCYKHLMRDRPPHAMAIFHHQHVLDSARLRHGHRQYKKERSSTYHPADEEEEGDDDDDNYE